MDAKITATSGKTEHGRRLSPLDSGHESSEPVVGSTAHSRGTAQVRDRSSTIDGVQISSPSGQAPFPEWRTFLTNHLEQMASIDFFVVPTATFRVLFVFVVLSHARRRVLHFQVTAHPSQDWTMQQIREAFPWDQGCRYLLRDRDAIYGDDWVEMTKGLGIEEVITAPRSPWQIRLWSR